MGSQSSEGAPNVVTETLFKTLIESACSAEVVCVQTAEKKSSVWYGAWIIRVVDPARNFEKLLVPARHQTAHGPEIVPRTFKTANGLISFLGGLGFTHITIPLYEGGRASHTLQSDTASDPSRR